MHVLHPGKTFARICDLLFLIGAALRSFATCTWFLFQRTSASCASCARFHTKQIWKFGNTLNFKRTKQTKQNGKHAPPLVIFLDAAMPCKYSWSVFQKKCRKIRKSNFVGSCAAFLPQRIGHAQPTANVPEKMPNLAMIFKPC